MAIHMLDAVMAKKIKGSLLTVRMDDQVYIEFAAAAALHGLSLSAFVHQYAYRTIRTEKERSPTEFARKVIEVEREIESNKKAKKSGALHPTDAEIEAELSRLEADLRANPDIYGIGLGGSLKVGKQQIETMIQDRLAKRRVELLKQRTGVVVRRQDRQTDSSPKNLTTQDDPKVLNRSISNEGNNANKSPHSDVSAPPKKVSPTRKANMKPADTSDHPPMNDVKLDSQLKMREASFTGKKGRASRSEAAERDIAKAKADAEELEKEEE